MRFSGGTDREISTRPMPRLSTLLSACAVASALSWGPSRPLTTRIGVRTARTGATACAATCSHSPSSAMPVKSVCARMCQRGSLPVRSWKMVGSSLALKQFKQYTVPFLDQGVEACVLYYHSSSISVSNAELHVLPWENRNSRRQILQWFISQKAGRGKCKTYVLVSSRCRAVCATGRISH